jgi:hypothetical protein
VKIYKSSFPHSCLNSSIKGRLARSLYVTSHGKIIPLLSRNPLLILALPRSAVHCSFPPPIPCIFLPATCLTQETRFHNSARPVSRFYTSQAMTSPTIKLSSGHAMPQVGFGLWKVDNATCADTVYNAIKTGYRLFDGACGMSRPHTRSSKLIAKTYRLRQREGSWRRSSTSNQRWLSQARRSLHCQQALELLPRWRQS